MFGRDNHFLFTTNNGLVRRWIVLVGGFLIGFAVFTGFHNAHRIPHPFQGAPSAPKPAELSPASQPQDEHLTPTSVAHTALAPPSSSPTNPSKAVIASVTDSEAGAADWIPNLLPDWQPFIFQIPLEAPPEDHLPDWELRPGRRRIERNTGREASVYITYIIENYDNLPDYMVFVHGKRYQTHNDQPMYDTYPLIRDLNLSHVEEQAYAPLRCNWKECPDITVRPTLGFVDEMWDIKGLYAEAWQHFFPETPIPEGIASPCCAQFAVTRAAVQRWPVEKYTMMLDYIWETDWPIRSVKLGMVFEFMWHVIFGKPAIWCPPAKPCYCSMWGLCDLDCPKEGWCHGRVWMKDAPHYFPEGWPSKGQDGIDWPYWGWWNDPEVVKEH